MGLLALQIFMGAFRVSVKWHMLIGILAYMFIFTHPLLMVVHKYIYISDFDPFYVFVDFCILCNGRYEFFINLGRFGLYAITVAVFAARFRNSIDFLKKHWRKLHVLNYLAFIFVSAHAINIGSDSSKPWFLIFFWVCHIVFLISVFKRLKEVFKPVV